MDITGQTINRIQILLRTEKRSKDRLIIYLCKCFCGKEFETTGKDIRFGRTRSCGCSRIKNLTGKTFGKLTVIEKLDKNKHGNFTWKCLCNCGNYTNVSGGSLTGGTTNSCGCLVKEINSESCRKRAGKKHYNWNPNLKDADRERRRNITISKSVMDRDEYTCNVCKKRGGDLVAHHLNGYHWSKKERYNLDNCITLCKKCHTNFHNIYGYKNNTKQQFIEYKNNYE